MSQFGALRRFKRHLAPHWLGVFGVGILLVLAGLYIKHLNFQKYHQQQRAEVISELSLLQTRLEEKIVSNLQTVQGIVAAIVVEPEMTQERFELFTKPVIDSQSQVISVAASPNLIVRMVYPTDGVEHIFGLDFRKDKRFREPVLRVKSRGEPIMAGPMDLFQGMRGFICRIPVYLHSPDEKVFWGIVSAIIHQERLFSASGLLDKNNVIDVALRGVDGSGNHGESFFGDPLIFDKTPETMDVKIPGGSWKIAAIPKNGWATTTPNNFAGHIAFAVIFSAILIPLVLIAKSAQKRRYQQQLLQGLFDNSPLCITLSRHHNNSFVDANPSALNIFGCTKEEFLNKSYKDFTPERYKESDAIQVHQLRTMGTMGPYEKHMLRKDGSEFPTVISSRVIEDEKGNKLIWSIFEDISARKKAELDLQNSYRQLKNQMAMLEAIADAQSHLIQQKNYNIIFRELLDDILILSGSASGFIGEVFYGNDGKPWLQTHTLIDKHDSEAAKSFKQRNNSMDFTDLNNLFGYAIKHATPVISNNPEDDPRSKGLPEGHPTLKNFVAVPILRNDEVTSVIGIANSTSEYDQSLVDRLDPMIKTVGQVVDHVRMIRAREKAEHELIQAKETAELAAKTKSEFLAMMSHEIRTPLNGVIGMIDILKHSELTNEQHHNLDLARFSADSLLLIINDILDFSKIDAGKLEMESIEFDLVEFLGNHAKSMAVKAQEKGIELILDTHAIDPLIVKSDPSRIKQILDNIVGNAIKFTPAGEILVRCNLTQTEGKLTLNTTISDTGVGIPKDKINHLFSPFTQADVSTTRKYGGTGLGLAISKKLCEQMNGNISVTSTESKGSTFTFNIELQSTKKESELDNDIDISGKNIVVITNNSTNNKTITNQFCKWGATCFSSTSIDDAYSFIAEHSIHLLIIDHALDKAFDFSVLETLRNCRTVEDTPIALMTNIAQPLSKDHIKAYEIDQSISKPLVYRDYQSAIHLIQKRRQFSIQSKAGSSASSTLKLTDNTQSITNKTILLVEDNPVNQQVASALLNRLKLNVSIAENGEEALLKLRNHPGKFCLILMDCHMPILDGYKTTQAIRQGDAGKGYVATPIVAMTANAMKGDREKCIDAGMDDYLTKPMDEKTLNQKLTLWINQEAISNKA